MEAENNSDEQEPHPPPSLPDSFPTSDDEINDSLWSLLTDTNFDISVIGEDQEPEPEPPTHPSLQESDVEEDLPEPVFDVKFDESQMYEMVAKEPTRSLLEIYEVVRQKYTAQLNPNSKLLFLQEFPSFLDLKTALLAQRRKFIPPDPKIMCEINIDLPVFITKAGENMGVYSTKSGRGGGGKNKGFLRISGKNKEF